MNEEIKIGGHISRQFDQELAEIRSRVLKMGGLVEAQLSKTLMAFAEGDAAAVLEVPADDKKVNDMEMLIDEECTQILARRQPTAGDLRMILATTKSVHDLERIGDEVERTARMLGHALQTDIDQKYIKGLLSLGENVKILLQNTLDTYARMSTRSAVKNMRLDRSIDKEYDIVILNLLEAMKADPERMAHGLDVMWAARSLERIGDHCINICENVIYLVEGQDVRHQSVSKIKERLS